VSGVALLDVNLLIALIDPRHVHHDLAHGWFAANHALGWASCPLTQNSVLRILGHPRYPNSPGSPALVAPLVASLLRHPDHHFWPDDLSLLSSRQILPEEILDSGRVTDIYLLALAVHHRGRLASLDQRLSTRSVISGEGALERIGGTDGTVGA